jgi:hypothetical protein
MKTLSLKLDDGIFEETEEIVSEYGIPRNRYINEALHFYNRFQKRKKLSKDFELASKMVKESSMQINKEMDELIDEGAI